MKPVSMPRPTGPTAAATAILVLLLLGPLAGCQQVGRMTNPPQPIMVPVMAGEPAHLPQSTLLSTSYMAADRLAQALVRRGVPPEAPILTASFVNIDDVTDSTTLGRMMSEQIASRMAQNGFRIIELRLRQGSMAVRPGEGEFLLTRRLQELGMDHGAHAVLVGTYAVSSHLVFVSCRLVSTANSALLAGTDFELPRDDITLSLMTPRQQATAPAPLILQIDSPSPAGRDDPVRVVPPVAPEPDIIVPGPALAPQAAAGQPTTQQEDLEQ